MIIIIISFSLDTLIRGPSLGFMYPKKKCSIVFYPSQLTMARPGSSDCWNRRRVWPILTLNPQILIVRLRLYYYYITLIHTHTHTSGDVGDEGDVLKAFWSTSMSTINLVVGRFGHRELLRSLHHFYSVNVHLNVVRYRDEILRPFVLRCFQMEGVPQCSQK